MPEMLMPDYDEFSIHVWAKEFDALPRPRLDGDDRRRPDVSRTSFQSAIARSFIDKPDEPFDSAVVTVAVPGGPYLPAVGTLKAVIDAAVSARVLRNDRSALLGASLVKFDLLHGAQPMTRVKVIPQVYGDPYFGSFIETPTQTDRLKVARCVVDPVAYADRSGMAGTARFQNRWVRDADEYEFILRNRWRHLVDEYSISTRPEDWEPLLLSARLTVHLPTTFTEDADNALLYVVDMLEIARQDIFGADEETPTLDQSLVEVIVRRNLESGVRFWLSPIEKHNQYPYYDTGEEDVYNPFDADAV